MTIDLSALELEGEAAAGLHARADSMSMTGPASPPSNPLKGFGCLLTAFAVVALAGLAGTWTDGGRPTARLLRASSWPVQSCTLLKQYVLYSTGGSRRQPRSSTSFHVLYTYTINDHVYRSTRYDFLEGLDHVPAAAILRYQPGTTVDCYVNPKDPEDAVLSRQWTLAFVPKFSLAVAFAGCFGFVVLLRLRRYASPPERMAR